jgi:hypothetical protein
VRDGAAAPAVAAMQGFIYMVVVGFAPYNQTDCPPGALRAAPVLLPGNSNGARETARMNA